MLTRPLAYALLASLALVLAAGLFRARDRADAGDPAPVSYDGTGLAIGSVPSANRASNLVVIVIDSLRADAVRPGEGGMPFLASLAERGVSMADAFAQAPWTKPSVASLVTGLLPNDHGALDSRHAPALPAALPTFAEILSRSYGYETAAFVDGPWWGGDESLLQGFRTIGKDFALQGTDETVGAWARRRDGTRPFFLLLHTLEAHEPYGSQNHPWPEPPVEVSPEALGRLAGVTGPADLARTFFLSREGRLALMSLRGPSTIRDVVRYATDGFAEDPDAELATELREAYLGGVAWVDGLLARAVDRLRILGLLEDTVLVVTSDHGEAFGEHGILGHGRQLHDELLHVPLVFQGPAPFEGGRVASGTVALADVLPTFFDLAGFPVPPGLEGRSVLPVLAGASPGRPVLAEEILSADNTGRPGEAHIRSVRSGAWKYIVTHDRTAGTVLEQLFDLAADPGEERNLANEGDGGFARVDPETCAAIHRVRESVWEVVAQDRAREGTPAGAGVSGVSTSPPTECAVVD